MAVLASLLFALAATASYVPGPASLFQKRDSNSICSDMTVNSNDGDRKVAIVVDSSSSMADNDPHSYRIAAARSLNKFLIAKGEGPKPDEVAVIEFSYTPVVDYPLGDPSGADLPISKIPNYLSGTYIAGGVLEAMYQIGNGTGSTSSRSAIVVFTDGEDSYTQKLVDAIGNATALGIRVSFGFINADGDTQDPDVLEAIQRSGGTYATIADPSGAQNFVNYVLLNGLTANDNAKGPSSDTNLMPGLAQTYPITGTESVTLKYNAAAGEQLNFTVTSILAGFLNATAKQGDNVLNQTKQESTVGVISMTVPSNGEVDLVVTSELAASDGLFSVLTGTNVPIKNCTVGVAGSKSGLSTGAKAGIGIGVTVGVLGMLAVGGYFGYKHFYTGGGTGAETGGLNTGGAENFSPDKFGPQTNVVEIHPGAPGGTMPPAPSGAEGQMFSPPSTVSPGGGIPPAPTGAESHMVSSLSNGAPGGGIPPAPTGAESHMVSSLTTGAPGGGMPPAPSGAETQMFSPPSSMPPGGGGVPPSAPQMFAPPSTAPPGGCMPPASPPAQMFTPPPTMAPPGAGVPPPPAAPGPMFTPPPVGQTFMAPPALAGSGIPPVIIPPLIGPPGGAGKVAGPNNSSEPADAGQATGGVYPSSTGTPGHLPPPTGTNHTYVPAVPPHQPHPRATGGGRGRRSQAEKHHHHAWLAPEQPCLNGECELNKPDHRCVPDEDSCPCDCRLENCPVNKGQMEQWFSSRVNQAAASGGLAELTS